MKRLMACAVMALLLLPIAGLFGAEKVAEKTVPAIVEKVPTFKEKHEQMLYTVVRVRCKRSAGSGTVVWSDREGLLKGSKVKLKVDKSNFHTYILTNHHVISGAITVKKVWDSKLGREVKKEFRSTVMVEFFKYNDYSRNVGIHAVQADILAYNEKGDIALLETRDKETQAKQVAHIFPPDKLDEVKIYDELYAVGASMGHAPISTQGILNFMDDEIDDLKYWMSSAQIIFGNSGGAMFRWSKDRNRFEWLGIPSRVTSTQWSGVVSHMGYFIPIPRVKNFLDTHKYRFVYSKDHTWKGEKKARDKEKKDMKRDLPPQVMRPEESNEEYSRPQW